MFTEKLGICCYSYVEKLKQAKLGYALLAVLKCLKGFLLAQTVLSQHRIISEQSRPGI